MDKIKLIKYPVSLAVALIMGYGLHGALLDKLPPGHGVSHGIILGSFIIGMSLLLLGIFWVAERAGKT